MYFQLKRICTYDRNVVTSFQDASVKEIVMLTFTRRFVGRENVTGLTEAHVRTGAFLSAAVLALQLLAF